MNRQDARLGPYRLFLPWFRWELPGWGLIYRWDKIGQRLSLDGWHEVKLRDSGCTMRLDLSEPFERLTFFLGRYVELDLQLVLRKALRPGDQFVDVGAHIGLISTLAAQLVGPSGRVHSFEPNPELFARLEEHRDLNRLEQIQAHPYGLSREEREFNLHVPRGDGASAFVSDAEPDESVTATHRVEVKRGEEVLRGVLDPHRRTAVKIDVEGHELDVLEGLAQVLETYRPLVTTEYLKGSTSRADLDGIFNLLMGLGYRAHEIGLARSGLGHRLTLAPVADSQTLEARTTYKADVLWLQPSMTSWFTEELSAGQ